MMKDTRSFDRRAFVRVAVTLVLALCLCLSILPAAPVSAESAVDAMNKLVSWGVINGDPDGGLYPDRAITRAEFVALVNRAYGYKETGNIPFLDVPYNAWYYDDISIAYNARYFDGTSATTAEPEATLTREQAMTLMARGMRLDSIPGEVTEFSDGHTFSSWSRGYVKAAYRKGLIGGYTDGTFKPLQNITRGEMAMLMARALGTLIHEAGEHTLGSIYGNVTINTPGTTLYDTTIVGDLYITGGLELGSVLLDNVRVLGSIIVAGGGESEAGEDSVILRNVKADELKIDSLAKRYLSVRAEGETVVTDTIVRTDCYIQDRTQAGKGLLGITLEGANGKYTLSGNLENVVNKAAGSTLKIARGTLGSLTVDETAVGSKLTIENDATVKQVNLDTAVNVTGSGDIGSLNVNTEGSSTSMLPDDINIRPGITSNVYGETMDTTLGQEASSDPRILAGYPKATDVAPTTLTATVATNKKGTLYWAVSSITDGSVGETELISPASYGSKAVKYGVLQVGKSNTDVKISVTGLTVGGNYYFSAILVDARNDRSPVKVMSFSTPDNTVPNFASGYPSVALNTYYTEEEYELMFGEDAKYDPATKYYAQFAVKSTKTTRLYWALYTKGSTAPTAAEFRSQSLAGAKKTGNGVGTQNVERNDDVLITVYGLEELKDYEIYFWLCDADGAKSSAVKKVSFKTVDGTPPEFVIEPTLYGTPKDKSLSMTTTLNEAGTVYWAIVKHGDKFPSPKPPSNSMDDEAYARLQVTSGSGNSLKNGKISVKANTAATFNISGLTAETDYDVWFVAQDSAGNYSVFVYTVDEDAENPAPLSYTTVRTLDVTAPTVRQENTEEDINGFPYPDTDIRLIFSEDVLRLDYEDEPSLLNCKDAEALEEFLKDNVKLICITDDGEEEVEIDYDYVSVAYDSYTSEVVLTYGRDAMELKSGTRYYFVLTKLADTSIATNKMASPLKLEQFLTVSSRVIVKDKTGDPVSVTRTEVSNWVSGQEDPIIFDAVFTLTPEATSREGTSRSWDMLIMSDTSLEFELYRRVVGSTQSADATSGEVNDGRWERLPGGVSFTTSAGSKVPDKDSNGNVIRTYKGQIEFAMDAATLRGLTLYRGFDYEPDPNYGTAKTVNHPLKDELKDGTVYEYGIHVVTLEGSDTRAKWSKNVLFQINIVAGDNLMNKLTNFEDVDDYYELKNSGAVEDITVPHNMSGDFQITARFQDILAPELDGGFPYFERYDTSLVMNVRTDRAGTLYYVAVPVGDATQTAVSPFPTVPVDPTKAQVDEKGEVKGFYIPYKNYKNIGDAVNDADDPSIDPKEAGETELSSPLVSQIYNPDLDLLPSGGKADAVKVSSVATPITIDGLAPSTGYFIYIVLKGNGATSYSDYVMLYQVATRPSERPVITLYYDGGTDVKVDTENKNGEPMDTTVNYVLLRAAQALDASEITGTTGGLRGSLKNHVVAGTDWDQLLKDYGEVINDKGDKDITIIYALTQPVPNDSSLGTDTYKGTIFDEYANDTLKSNLSRFILTSVSNSNDYIMGAGSVDVPQIVGSGKNETEVRPATVDCTEYGIASGPEYIFLATAQDASKTQRGFRGSYPVVKKDDVAPSVIDIQMFAELETATPKAYITVRFDRNVYYSVSGIAQPLYCVSTSTDVPTVEGKTPVDITKIQNTISPPNSITFTETGIIAATIPLEWKISTAGGYIEFDEKLCNEYGTFQGTHCTVTITVEKDKNSGDWYATATTTDWKEGNVHTSARVLVRDGSTIATNMTSLTLPVTVSQPIIATVTSPAYRPTPTVTWSSSNEKVATVSSTGVVTALKAGKATITASIKDGDETVSATCEVTVTSAALTLDESSIALTTGGTRRLTPTITPAQASTPTVTWTSSDDKIATVDKYGTVTGVKPGTATIKASAKVGNETIYGTCEVTVIGPKYYIQQDSAIVSKTGSTTLSIGSDFGMDMIETVHWYFGSTQTGVTSVFTTGYDGGTTITVSWAGGGNPGAQDKIYAQITTKDGSKHTVGPCQLTLN